MVKNEYLVGGSLHESKRFYNEMKGDTDDQSQGFWYKPSMRQMYGN